MQNTKLTDIETTHYGSIMKKKYSKKTAELQFQRPVPWINPLKAQADSVELEIRLPVKITGIDPDEIEQGDFNPDKLLLRYLVGRVEAKDIRDILNLN